LIDIKLLKACGTFVFAGRKWIPAHSKKYVCAQERPYENNK
jgi:hypothetical protein